MGEAGVEPGSRAGGGSGIRTASGSFGVGKGPFSLSGRVSGGLPACWDSRIRRRRGGRSRIFLQGSGDGPCEAVSFTCVSGRDGGETGEFGVKEGGEEAVDLRFGES